MEIKSINPKLKQSEIAKELGCSNSTLKRYRKDIIMLSTYKFPSNTNKRKRQISNTKHGPERPQMSSNDLVVSENDGSIKPIKSKNKMKGGANTEINGEYSDEVFHNNNLIMELAVQIISND